MTTLSPRENFYLHVNKQWLEDPKNSIPPDYSSWGGFIKLHDTCLKEQINIVNDFNSEENLDINAYKVKCLNTASKKRFESWRENTANLQPIINELNYFKNLFEDSNLDFTSKLSNYFHYSQLNGISNVMDFDTGSNLENVSEVLLDFSTGGLSLPSREYYKSSEFENKYEMFKKHLASVKEIIGGEYLRENFVEEVLKFENYLADFAMKPEQSREYDAYYTNTTLEGLYTNLNELKSLKSKEENYDESDRNFRLDSNVLEKSKNLFEKIYTLFDFRKVMENNFTKNGLSESENIYRLTAFDGDCIRRTLNLLLNENMLPCYSSYMHYKIICAFKSYCTKDLDDEFFDFYSRKLGGQQEQKSEEKRTMSIINNYGGEMMGKLYIQKFFSENSKKSVKGMIENVLDIMRNSLDKNDWLTQETKEKALEKLGVFRTKIGFPEENGWKDYSDFDIKLNDDIYTISKKYKEWSSKINFLDKINSILDREEWHMTPQTVNAYFMPTQNEIVFPAAILQPPFFHSSEDTLDFDVTDEKEMCPNLDLITPANFGGIGAVIAHEITHGYDDKGRKFDLHGNLNDWWNNQDTELFKQKTDLMVKSVEKYIYTDAQNNEHKMSAQLTMGENLADIGGLSLSLQSLKQVLKSKGLEEHDINFKASLRVFFKAWANIWKQNMNEDKRVMLLNVDPHAPTDFRGNLVQHIAEFYSSFDVKEGDGMWLEPEERMRMW